MEYEQILQLLRESHGKLLLSKKETASELSVTGATVDRLRKTGDIVGIKVKGQVMFTIGEIASFICDAQKTKLKELK